MPVQTVTQKDIARRLSISQSHVAGVLAGNPRTGASAQTSELILNTAREMGYVPHAAGASLRRGSSNTIALVYVRPTDEFGNHYLSDISHVIAEEAGHLGLRLEVRAYGSQDEILGALPTLVRSQACQVMLLWGLEEEVEAQGCLLEELGQAFVARGHFEASHPHWVQVEFDHDGMIRLAVASLADRGHRRIAYLGHQNRHAYARIFHQGFRAAMRERFGLAVPDEWLLFSDETLAGQNRLVAQIEGWMKLPPSHRPTAIACGDEGSVLSFLEVALLAHGIAFGDEPGQMALAGSLGRLRLLAGHAMVFPQAMDHPLNREMVRCQIVPMVQGGEPRTRALRYLPQLQASSPPFFHGDLKQWFRNFQ